MISWDQLAKHLGNDADSKRFRQTVRETMQLVSAVYPNADVDFSGRKVVLRPSPAPLERKLVGPHLRLLGAPAHETAPRSSVGKVASTPVRAAKVAEPVFPFPGGSLTYGEREAKFRAIGLEKGRPWCVDTMANAFRAGFPGITQERTDAEWLRVWEAFVVRYAERRASPDAR